MPKLNFKKLSTCTPKQLEAAKHRNQKLIIINGIINSGKTVIFNLFRKETNYICLDISDAHYGIYKDKILEQLGKRSVLAIEDYIKNTHIFLPDVFLREIGLLMKKYPTFSFVIKPGFKNWLIPELTAWDDLVKKYLPISSSNLHSLFVLRHPKMGWVTNTIKNSNIDAFINAWTTEYKLEEIERCQLIKLEEIKHNEFLKSLIKKTDLNTILTYSNFDLQVKISNEIDNGFEHLEDHFKRIELDLGYFIKHFNYDIEDKNVAEFLNSNLTEEEQKIQWVEV